MDFEVINVTLKSHFPELEKEFGVSRLGIFGSVARGEADSESDVDILVDFDRPVGLVTFIELENRLRQMLGARVDLVSRKALKPHIGRRILDEIRYVH